jgi:hypothetical protein
MPPSSKKTKKIRFDNSDNSQNEFRRIFEWIFKNYAKQGKTVKVCCGCRGPPRFPPSFVAPSLRKNFRGGSAKTPHPLQLPSGDQIRKLLNADLKYSFSATFKQKLKKKLISTIPRILKTISEEFLRGFSEIMQIMEKTVKTCCGSRGLHPCVESRR